MNAQLRAAQRQLESECDCCDADPRAIAAEAAEARAELDPLPHTDAEREWAGMERGSAVDHSLAEVRHLNQVLGPDWADGLPF